MVDSEVRRMNWKLGQRWASSDTGWKNITGQLDQIDQSGNYCYSSIRVALSFDVALRLLQWRSTRKTLWFKVLGKIYFALELQNWILSINLDSESQLLTTFNSPFGRYCFSRMLFGPVISQYVFQQKMDMILEKFPAVKKVEEIKMLLSPKSITKRDKNHHQQGTFHFASFVPHITNKRSTKKESEFSHQKSLQSIKGLICTEMMLT